MKMEGQNLSLRKQKYKLIYISHQALFSGMGTQLVLSALALPLASRACLADHAQGQDIRDKTLFSLADKQ